jgi:hypothetical protein
MEIGTSLGILSKALGIVKELKEIDKNFDMAHVRNQMADLYLSLADVKIALADAKQEISDKEKIITQLEEKIDLSKKGEKCVLCENGYLKVTASRPHPEFSFAGVQERTLSCTECRHSEKRFYDPNKS